MTDDDDEPLGDIAAEIRERTGERAPEEVRDPPHREGPLADVASAVDERRRRDRDRDASDPFESVEVGELDGEKLWARLAEGDDGPAVTVPPEETVEVGVEGVDEVESDDRDVRTIPKATCHGCPHFGEPPDLACTHEGTAILAMPDSDHFRVADCPMVVGDEEIGSIAVGEEDGDGDTEAGGDSDFGVGGDGDAEVGGDDEDSQVGEDEDDPFGGNEDDPFGGDGGEDAESGRDDGESRRQ